MIKTRQTILRCITSTETELLKTTQQEAARCWNDIVVMANEHYKATGKWLGKDDLQKQLKQRYKLHSQTVQALTDKFAANRETSANLRRQGINCRYPWREKKYLTIPFKQNAIKTSPTGTIILTLTAGQRIDTGFIPPLPVKTCEIMWRKGQYILSWTAEYSEAVPRTGSFTAGIDIGEIHPVAVTAEDGTGLIVSGRGIRSIKQLRNKSLAWFSKAISRCSKGSRRMKRLIRAKASLKAKSSSQVRDLLHQATRKTIDWCVTRDIAELVIGDPKGVEQNTKKKKRLNRHNRQKVSQMEYGKIKQYLQYKAKEAGIATCFKNERYTSKECPVCRKMNHPTGRVYSCACGFKCHRDGKAGFMMIRKKYPDTRLPLNFRFHHVQAFPMYRKRLRPACVDGPDVALSSLVIAGPLHSASLTA